MARCVCPPEYPNSTDTGKGSVANPSLVQEGGLEHDVHPHEHVVEEAAVPAEAGDGAVQHSTNTPLDVAQAVHVKGLPQTPEDILSPSNPNADSQPSAKSHPPRRRKRMPDPSYPEPEPERPKKRSSADQVQEELLAKANQLMDASVTVHDIIFVLERFALLRNSTATRGHHADHTDQDEPQQQDPDRRLGLKKWWDGLDVHEKGERWEKCLQRVFAGLFYCQYVDERQAFDERKKKENLPHPSEMYLTCTPPRSLFRMVSFHLNRLLLPVPKQRGIFKTRYKERSCG